MKRKQYDLDFKKMVLAKGKEVGNMNAVARQHELSDCDDEKSGLSRRSLMSFMPGIEKLFWR